MPREDRTVWIVNRSGHDYSEAEKYGKLKPLTIDDVNPLQVDRLASHLARGIGSFASEGDFLLISGTPIINGLAIHLWLRHFGSCKVLQWNAKARDYELTTLTDKQLGTVLENAVLGV